MLKTKRTRVRCEFNADTDMPAGVWSYQLAMHALAARRLSRFSGPEWRTALLAFPPRFSPRNLVLAGIRVPTATAAVRWRL